MTALLLLCALIVGAVVQALFPPWLTASGFSLLSALVVYYALAHGAPTLLVAALVGGLIQDSLGMIPLGYSSFCFCIAGLVVSRYRDEVFEHQVITHVIFGALTAGGTSLVLGILLSTGGLVTTGAGGVLGKTVASAILGGILTPPVCHLMRLLDRNLGDVSAGEDS